jgi:hypothetical protein
LTIYNQNFAVVRVMVALQLKAGINIIQYNDITAFLEPDSVILRDPTATRVIRVLEQNYRADPVSQQLLLSVNEGKTIEFIVQRGDKNEVVQGKIIRSGYNPTGAPMPTYGYQPYPQPSPGYEMPGQQTIVEIDGKLRFGLPGTPLFPSLAADTVLKPTVNWVLETDKPGNTDAELSYVTGAMNWEASYNAVAPETGDTLELVGWVTIHNQTGKSFQDARIKLMAGEVSKLAPVGGVIGGIAGGVAVGGPGPPVSEKTFEEYHLYELHRPTTLHDQETKQVEFVRASGIKSERIYVYDGLKLDPNQYQGWSYDAIRQNREYGTQSNPKVWVMREFVNSEANRLGMPLPAGRLRFYRRDTDGHLEFTGENTIQHTPRDETIRVYTGTAFDVVGERRRTEYRIDMNRQWLDESFEIKLRNHKKERVEVRMLEHLYRGASWDITQKSNTYLKTGSQTMEFRVQVDPDSEKTVTYTVHYTW